MTADTFILYDEYNDYLKKMNVEQIGVLFMAIFAMRAGESLPKMDALTDMVFTVIKNDIERNTAKYSEKCQRNKENGAKGGRPKAEEKPNCNSENQAVISKTENNPKEPNGYFENPCECECDSECDSECDINTPIPPKGADGVQAHEAKKQETSTSKAFAQFWEAYPRKVGKENAIKAWNKLRPNKGLCERIMLAVDRANKSYEWQKDNGQFIPHPATWLNRGGWEDEYISKPPNSVQPNQATKYSKRQYSAEDYKELGIYFD